MNAKSHKYSEDNRLLNLFEKSIELIPLEK